MQQRVLTTCLAVMVGVSLCTAPAFGIQSGSNETSTPPRSPLPSSEDSELQQTDDDVSSTSETASTAEAKPDNLDGNDDEQPRISSKDVEAASRSASTQSEIAAALSDSSFDIGDGQPYADLTQAVAAIPENAGDVTFIVHGSIHASKEFALELPTNKGITSIRIISDESSAAVIGPTYYSSRIYAGGIPVTVGANVTLNGELYGGTNGTDLTSNTSLVIEAGATVKSVYGGCLNATLTGNTSIIIEGTASSLVVGGGRAVSSTASPNALADVVGSTTIRIGTTGSAASIHGAGRAEMPLSAASATSSQANVSGSCEVRIEGTFGPTNGGGWAGLSSHLYSVENATAIANVGGDTSVVFSASAQATDAFDSKAYGGGWAQGSLSLTNHATADVSGSSSIEALSDDTASSKQPNEKAFLNLCGGGYAAYGNAQSNVYGDTNVTTARPCWNSDAGIVGAGYAYRGGMANVAGTTHIEVFGIDGQRASYENANHVIGGGWAENFLIDEPLASAPTTATAGATEIVIHADAAMKSAGTTGENVFGGGMARGNFCTVDVSGSASISIESGAVLTDGIVGGGIVWGTSLNVSSSLTASRSSANVGGTSIAIGDNVHTYSVIGGGYVAVNATDSSADTLGQISFEAGTDLRISSNFIAAGKADKAPSSHANVGSNKQAVAVSVKTGSGFTTSNYYGGGYVQGINTETYESTANVIGSIETYVAGGSLNTFFGGSCVNNLPNGRADIDGNIDNHVVGYSFPAVSSEYLARIVGAGVVLGNKYGDAAQAVVSGNVTTRLVNCTINGNGNTASWPYAGGRYGSDVLGTATLCFSETDLANQPIYAEKNTASWRGSIVGETVLQFVGTTSYPQWVYASRTDGDVRIVVGDSEGSPTDLSVFGVYGTNADRAIDVSILPSAKLTLTSSSATSNFHLSCIRNIDVAEGATLAVEASVAPATITGNLTGAGTISLPAGGMLAGDASQESKLEGSLTLLTTGELTENMAFFDFSKASTGTVAFEPPTAQQRYYLTKDTESQPGRALWTIATGTAVTVKQAEHGTIEPSEPSLNKGEPTTFTFTPEYGFRVENVLIDGEPVADTGETDGRTATYTFTPSGDSCEVSATFVALEKEDLREEIEKLPDFSDPSTVTDDDRNAILDAKLDYEAFIENNPDEPLDPDAIDKLHEALMQLPEIELEIVIEVAAEDGAADGVVEISEDCLHHFAYQLEQNELKALRDGSTELLKIVAVVDEGITEPEEDESTALSTALGDDYSIGKHFNVTVTKQVFEKKDDEKPLSAEPLHSLEKGVTMTFAVPAELAAPEGTTRAYAIARTHQEDDGSWNASILADENEADPTSVTVTSDRFSRYAIVYTETAASDDPNEPTVPDDPSDDPATPDDPNDSNKPIGKPDTPASPNDSAKPLPDPADTDDSTDDEAVSIVAVGDHGAAAGVAAIGALAFAALIAARFAQRRIR